MNLFEKEEQTAPQRLQIEMEQALTVFMKDDVGLHLFEVPTGQGKTEVATNVMAKMLRDWMEKGTPCGVSSSSRPRINSCPWTGFSRNCQKKPIHTLSS